MKACITYHNNDTGLAVTLATLQAQIIPPEEIIVIDTSPTKSGLDICQRYATNSVPIKVECARVGIYEAWNRGIDLAQGSDVVILNDDLLLLRPATSGWEVHATPFGRRRHPEVAAAPLRALLRLVQAPQDALEAISSAQALAELVANSPVVNADVARASLLFQRWQTVLQEIPAYRLHFRKANTFWEVIDAHFG